MKKSKHAFLSVLLVPLLLFSFGCTKTNPVAADTPKSSPPAQTAVTNEKMVQNTHLIEGYSDKVSYAPGEVVQLKVHTLSPHYSVDVMRFGAQVQSLLKVSDLPGKIQNYAQDAYEKGANWDTTYSFTIPDNWHSGMYAAKLLDDKKHDFYVTFIVKDKPATAAKIAVLASTNTWQAYNVWGGASFYRYLINDNTGAKQSNLVNQQRPNPEATPIGNVGHHAQAELHILSWLEKQGYSYSMLTDWDLNQNPNILQQYQAVIINTHSEYWSQNMYDGLDHYLQKGGHLLNLSGNTMYWKVVMQGDQMEVRKDNTKQQLNGEPGGTWADLGHPESALLGVGYNTKGYNTFAPYQVLTANHWIYQGTGLHNGDLIGTKGLNHDGASGWETDKSDAHSPANLVVLARGTNANQGGAEITYYDTPSGGGVFSVGSITFGGSLAVDGNLSKLVNNVLHHFLGEK